MLPNDHVFDWHSCNLLEMGIPSLQPLREHDSLTQAVVQKLQC